MGDIWSRRRFLVEAAFAIAASGCAGLGPPPTSPAEAGAPGAAAASRPAASQKIVVVGGGLTGLAIARELGAQGRDVLVLEASNRPGGRIHTLREPFRDGLYVEAGATHVVPDPDLLALLAAARVEVKPHGWPKSKLSHVAVRGRERVVTPPGKAEPSEYSFPPEEEKLGEAGRLEKYFAPIVGVDPTAPLPPAIVAYDDISAADFLENEGASSEAARAFHDAFAPDDALENLSAMSLMREIANIRHEIALPKGGGRIVGGADTFPKALADALGERVQYEALVTRIEHGPDGAKVSYTRRGERVTVEALRVVCALPSTVLRSIEFAPALSDAKARAIRELGLVSVSRVFVACDRPFWLDQGEAGVVETDTAMGRVRDDGDHLAGPTGILGVYVTGAEARRLGSLTEEARIEEVLALAERAHPGARARCYGGASKCWDDDPLQRGAYARFRPKELTTLVPELARAESVLHFAGDQTSYRPGFMHGALASSRRVLAEILPA